MDYDTACPYCGCEFVAVEWEPGQCPECGACYYWTEFCTEDYSDCWSEMCWD